MVVHFLCDICLRRFFQGPGPQWFHKRTEVDPVARLMSITEVSPGTCSTTCGCDTTYQFGFCLVFPRGQTTTTLTTARAPKRVRPSRRRTDAGRTPYTSPKRSASSRKSIRDDVRCSTTTTTTFRGTRTKLWRQLNFPTKLNSFDLIYYSYSAVQVCRQRLEDPNLLYFPGPPAEAVEEVVAITDPSLSLFTGDEQVRLDPRHWFPFFFGFTAYSFSYHTFTVAVSFNEELSMK